MTVRRLRAHPRISLSTLAVRVFDTWRAAACDAERRNKRASALQLNASSKDPKRLTAICVLGEALKECDHNITTEDAAMLAKQLEESVLALTGATGKEYKSKCRSTAALLRHPRAGSVRKRLRDGDLSATEFLQLDATEVTLTDEQKRQRLEKRMREARAIDSLRADAQGEASDAYRCPECSSTRCNLFSTNSMGAVHLTAVPDMIVQCLACFHRFTI